ncbi:hypothetical protein BJY01DRAFT_213839 [Aspergillus pseudoustus]|uniref:Transcription factor domain-containing protein n=1 Tax=Aspergillus pseudoustus TaxID=1810923 RepID=A0ABR4K0P5_9EURO
MLKNISEHCWHASSPDDREITGKCFEATMLQFLHQVIRVFAHLPYLLNSAADPKSECCRLTSLEAARESLVAYREFRTARRPYLYRLIDFLAFTIAMVLVVHSISSLRAVLSPQHLLGQGARQDLELVRATATTLLQAGTGNRGTAASESSNILQTILDNWSEGSSSGCRGSSGPLSISLPYFGPITICPGKVLAERLRRGTLGNVPMPQYREQQQQPSRSGPCFPTTNGVNGKETQRTQVEQAPTELHQSGYPVNTRMWLEEIPSSPVAGWELSEFFDDIGHGLWSSLEFDENLDKTREGHAFFQ